MILYSVTVSVEPAIHDDWVAWMRDVHIPEVMATGCFSENRMLKVLSTQAPGELTYSIQYTCSDMKTYERYRDEYAPALQQAHTERYRDRFVAFRTLLKYV